MKEFDNYFKGGYTEEEKKIATNFFLDNSRETHRTIGRLSMGEGATPLCDLISSVRYTKRAAHWEFTRPVHYRIPETN